ncbi:CapA family protein [Actinokineospora fastidiosa]|uniref:Poly-gamma-glutamate biosynthesis protein n=1 Tax=Actinokineospora fastidiosa TaxID=1816 RepID=A0A918L9M3_9PSEU|nr:CapA family protein [Actinokineospora fastidiosa]GGS21884.1 poly-gamma-glutamate biosynthesis protein [Actinokineospora fastidiosa]
MPTGVGATTPPAAPPPTTTQQAPDGFTIVAGGDVLIHPALTEQAEADGNGTRDYGPLFAGIAPVVSAADLAVCHLEVPLAGPDGPFQGYPRFNAPPEVADGLAQTGYDVCTTASNHTMDHGAEGAVSTLDVLDDAGIKHTGSARSAEEAGTPLILDVPGAKVGWLSYTFAFNSGTEVPADSPWMANVLDADTVIADAEAAREAGADVVVASLHWGVEGKHDPTAEQRRLAEEILGDPAVDLIIGHHAHVVQPFEAFDGKWVAYGLGNQVARHAEPKGTTEEGALARFRFTKGPDGWAVSTAEYIPTLVDLGPPIRLLDLTGAEGARAEQAIGRTEEIVTRLGADADGLTRPGA